MIYEIIPQNLYFTPGVDNFLTPSWLNEIFNNINSHAMASDRYIRPLQFTSTANVAVYTQREDAAGSAIFGSFSPGEVTISEVGSSADLLPGDWEVFTYTWTFDPDSTGFANQGFSSLSDDNKLTISHDGETIPTTTYLKARLDVTYTSASEAGSDITLSAVVGIPVSYIADGEAAISTPQPLINITSTHQPIEKPGGTAVFTAEDISFLPPGVSEGSGVSRSWSLTHNGNSKDTYITVDNSSVSIEIPEVGKNFQLTLTQTLDNGAEYSTSLNLYTYDYGSFFFSAWGSETPVDAARTVTLEAINSSKQGNPLFPKSDGSMLVKWGKNIDDLQLQNSGSPTGQIICIPWFSSDSDYKTDVETKMTAHGLIVADENPEEYSLINVYDNGEDLTGLFFWTQNMNQGAEILYKVQDTANLVSTYTELATNSVYLVKGICPAGIQTAATAGPGGERYYVSLKHYSLSGDTGTYVYNGTEDRFQTVSQSGTAAPILSTFSDIPKGTYYKAEVISAKGSAYSVGQLSNVASIGDIDTANIDTLLAESSQYGVELGVTWSGSAPIGFLASYLEIDSTTSWPSNAHLYHTQVNNPGMTTLYSNAPTLRLPAKVGKKVVATVRAVMHDGSLSDPVSIEPVTVAIPTSLEQRDFSKNLGRVSTTIALDDTSLVDNTTPQHNLFYTSFARDTYLEAVHIWVHSNTTSATLVVQTDELDSGDEKTKILALNNTGGNHDFYTISDLSLPVAAGEHLVMAIQGATPDIDITVEIHYSPGAIIQYTDNTQNQGNGSAQ